MSRADCVEAYDGGRVAYARDAFDGLTLMDHVMTGKFDEYNAAIQISRAGKPSNRGKRRDDLAKEYLHSADPEEARARRNRLNEGLTVPTPPFWGSRIVEHVPVKTLIPFINERSLFSIPMGFPQGGP